MLAFGFAAWVQSEESGDLVGLLVVLLVVLGSITAGLPVLLFIEPLLVEPVPTPPVAEPAEPDVPPTLPLAPALPEPLADCAIAEVARPTARAVVAMILRSSTKAQPSGGVKVLREMRRVGTAPILRPRVIGHRPHANSRSDL